MPLEVTASDDPFGFMGSLDVLIRDQASLDLLNVPTAMTADGVSTVKLTAVVKDQLGQPLDGVPLVVRYQMPGSRRQAAVVWTDAKGIATFTTPAVTLAGQSSFQFEAEHLVSDQVLVTYEDPRAGDAKK